MYLPGSTAQALNRKIAARAPYIVGDLKGKAIANADGRIWWLKRDVVKATVDYAVDA